MKKKYAFLIISILVFIIFGYFLFQIFQNNKIKKNSNNYLINLVGEEEFSKNYKLKLSSIFGCSNNEYGCWVKYEFLPGEKYGGNKYYLYYSTSKNEITGVQRFSEEQLPSCIKDKNNCDFKLTTNELKIIITKEDEKGARSTPVKLILKDNKILIRVNYCDILGDNNQKKILIDPKSKEVVWQGESTECGVK